MLDLAKLRIDIFRQSLESEVRDNLSEYLLSTVSNMLALNYALDKALQAKYDNMHEYASICSGALKKFLKSKVILDETFDIALSLFIVAITPEDPYTEDLPSISQLKNKSTIATLTGYECYKEGDISAAERDGICEVISAVLDEPSAREIIDLAVSKPEIMIYLLRKKQKTKDIVKNLSDLAQQSAKASSIVTDFKQFAGLISCAALGFAANIAVIQVAPAIAAVAVIPLSVGTLKYGAKLGELLGEKLSNFEVDVRKAKAEITRLVSDFTNDLGLATQNKTPEVSRSADLQQQMQHIHLDDIAKDFGHHISTETVASSHVQNTERQVEKQKDLGRTK